MASTRGVTVAKLSALGGFLVLLLSTYYLRSEVLALNRIRFSADEARANFEQKQLAEDYPREVKRYEVAKENYQLQLRHYEEMLKLYNDDYEAYVKRLKDEYTPPQLPSQPQPPRPPEYTRKLADINTQFRERKYQYFAVTSVLNWVAAAAALCLVGGLLYLILFDSASNRLLYFLVLVLSFVFMIGPSFHSIISAIVGFLEAPHMY